MNEEWQYWKSLTLKELRETFRDRRTILTLVLMPLLVYPILGMAFQKLLVTELTGDSESIAYQVGCDSEATAEAFSNAMNNGLRELGENSSPGKTTPVGASLAITYCDAPAYSQRILVEQLEEHIIDVAVLMKPRPEHKHFEYEFLFDRESRHARDAMAMITDRLQTLNLNEYRSRLRDSGLPMRSSLSWTQRHVRTASGGGAYIATLIPLALILMTVTGAVYPAIDLTAGERERGTLELMAATPTSSQDILFAKYIAVLACAMCTATINLVAMWVTLWGLNLETLVFGTSGTSLWTLLQIFGLLVLFASFFSGVLLAVTCHARSFKEAQAYLIPIMLVAMGPGMMSLMPGLVLNLGTAFIPLMNMVLLTRDLLKGIPLPPLLTMLALAATALYAMGAVWLAGRSFSSDAFLIGSNESWADLWRFSGGEIRAPLAIEALRWVIGLLPAFIVLGSWPTRWTDSSFTLRLFGSMVITWTLFVFLPLLWCFLCRYGLTQTFQLRRTNPLYLLLGLWFALGAWTLAYEMELLVLPASSIDKLKELFEPIRRELAQVPFGFRIIMLGLAPACAEELFFRGFFQSGLRRQWGAFSSILTSAACFGLFHVFVRDVLTFERFVPSALLGILLGLMAERTGSLFPGMLFHAGHNSLLLTLGEFEGRLKALGIGMTQQQHLPLWVILCGATAVSVGVFVLVVFPNGNPDPEFAHASSTPINNRPVATATSPT